MKVLITGATGLVGSHVSELFRSHGHTVHYLTTRKSAIKNEPDFKGFLWNVDQMEIDKACIDGVDTIIHLAGESVFQRWTADAKKRIMDSRLFSTQLLVDLLRDNDHNVKQVITASAIGIYPDDQQADAFKEDDIPPTATNYLADVCIAWEKVATQFKDFGVIHTTVRIGIVLAHDDGALKQMAQPVKFYAGAGFGNGKMWQSWIAVHDLAGIFHHITQHRLEGIFNGVAPQPVRNRPMMEAIGKQLGKPVFLPNVPKFVMKIMLGEMAAVVLASQHVSSHKIEQAGFKFDYPALEQALDKYL